MFTRSFRLAATLLGCGAVAVAVGAAAPSFWQTATEADFLRGEVENLAIDPFGRLTLGPTASPVYEASAPFLWATTTMPDGTIYVGSGNEGQVYQIDASGRGRVFFDSDELEVHALAAVPGGGLYVATSPNGKIYKVDAGGKAAPFFDPPDAYIWSLAVDRAGTVYAATGDKGTIYKIAPDGKGAVFYQTKATHAMTLAFDREGRLLAGTGSPGRVFRLDASGKPFVLFDSSYTEIHQLRVDTSGNIYATALSGRPPGGGGGDTPPPASPAAPAPVATVTTEITVVAVADIGVSGASQPQASARPSGPTAGAVFRISPDGATDVLWETREDTPYDLAFEPGGTVLVGTGGRGKLFRLTGDPARATLVARADAQQVTALTTDRNGQVLFATSNPGKLFRLSATRAERGTFTSDVRDAQTVATWGVIKWQGLVPSGTRVEVATRSGNTKTPDEAWSDWSAPYATAEGSAITSPRARYLQWRAVLIGSGRTEAPLLTSLTAAYLPRNARPRVTSITVHTPGTVYQRPFPTGEPEIAGFDGDTPDRRAAAQLQGTAGPNPNLGRRAYEKGLLTFIWRAEDENRDDLVYELQYRREGETTWHGLKQALADAIFVWDTTSVPNGRYTVRVIASDTPSNSAATALSGDLESTAFDIDNTPPVITVTATRRDGARTTLAFDVRDDNSAVQKVEYSLDGDRWQAVYPKDGIADSRVEQYELTVPEVQGALGVVLRAADALNNVSSARGVATAAPSGGR
jgi:outer membrane protein assembly factor BamB